MATTEMESGSLESRSEQGTADPDSKYPMKVLYCGGAVYKTTHQNHTSSSVVLRWPLFKM